MYTLEPLFHRRLLDLHQIDELIIEGRLSCTSFTPSPNRQAVRKLSFCDDAETYSLLCWIPDKLNKNDAVPFYHFQDLNRFECPFFGYLVWNHAETYPHIPVGRSNCGAFNGAK